MGFVTNPCHPGEILKHEFLEPLGISEIDLAEMLGVQRTRIERLVNAQTAIAPDTAKRLSRAFGTTPEFWVNLQTNYDVAYARKKADVYSVRSISSN